MIIRLFVTIVEQHSVHFGKFNNINAYHSEKKVNKLGLPVVDRATPLPVVDRTTPLPGMDRTTPLPVVDRTTPPTSGGQDYTPTSGEPGWTGLHPYQWGARVECCHVALGHDVNIAYREVSHALFQSFSLSFILYSYHYIFLLFSLSSILPFSFI